ncbi:MAG TPA: LemA family protein [Candidatus Pacearchaeota archaeon]|nr:LemA family protein [Candidatus Pacearchaeota archaeon]
MALLWILIGLGVLIAIVFFSYYNRFATLENRVDNSLSQIDVQLKRRADLIPNLIETVKGFVKHEKAAITAVTEARKALVSAKGIENRVKADKTLQSALSKIFIIAENYPTLKADTNFLELQRELATTEDRIAYARQFYNDSILSYNDLCKLFPGKFFAGIYGKKPKQYLQIAESERKNVKVQF